MVFCLEEKKKALNYVNMEYAARHTYDISCTADMTSVGLAQARPNYVIRRTSKQVACIEN